MHLTAIIPRLPPVVDGIGDYALSLARLLRDNVGITTRFIVTDPAWTGPDCGEDFEIRQLTSHSSDELLNLLAVDSDTFEQVLLHYEGYGYAQRGCPVWLVTALERWRQEKNERRLITMFHELYATGPPWTSSFWLSPLQRNLATRLARLSDQWLTSLEPYARAVQQMRGDASPVNHHLAVFSSIGEPKSTPPLKERARRLVVFGTRGRRIEVYKKSSADLNRISAALGIEEIVDIGRPIEENFSRGLLVRSSVFGLLSAADVSELLLDSVAGVIDYPASLLCKSTIFAAYCSHRMIPIVANYGDGQSLDVLAAGAHYWLTSIESEQMSLETGQSIADRAFDWYQTHNLSVHARTLADFLMPAKLATHI